MADSGETQLGTIGTEHLVIDTDNVLRTGLQWKDSSSVPLALSTWSLKLSTFSVAASRSQITTP